MELIRIEVQTQAAWLAAVSREGGWVAVCDHLGLTVQGETWEELMATSNEVVNELMRDLFMEGDLERFLREKGFQTLTPLPDFRQVEKPPEFDVPIQFLQKPAPELRPGH